MPRSSSAQSEPAFKPEAASYSFLLAESFLRLTGKPLIVADDIPHALYHAPFALVSHGTQADPIFRYANLAAQRLWGIGWDDFVRMPSRLTAEPEAAEARQRLLDEAARNGYVDHYQGVRITADKKRFVIKDTLLWTVTDAQGLKHGQAAAIRAWEWL